MNRILLVSLVTCLCSIPSVSSFILPHRSHKNEASSLLLLQQLRTKQLHVPTTTTSMAGKTKGTADDNNKFNAPAPSYTGYNDDAFGLLFLTSGVATKDIAFGLSFVALSALAATTTTMGVWNQENDARVPGAVAMVALIVGRPLVMFGLLPLVDIPSLMGLDFPPITLIPPTFEIAVCFISLAWAFYNWKSFQEKASE